MMHVRSKIFVGDNVISKQTNSREKVETNFPTLSELQLFKEEQKLHITEQQLQKRKKSYVEKKTKLNQKWANLRSDELTFKENFINFNNFMLSNIEKKKRASNNIEYQKNMRIDKEIKIANIQAEISNMRNYRIELDEKLAKYKCYKIYLERVALRSSESELKFKTLDDIVNCYETYINLAADISKNQILQFMQLEENKFKMDCYIEECNERILGLHTKVAHINARFEESKRKTLLLEHLVSKIKSYGNNKFTDVVITKSAIWNLYRFMFSRSGFTVKLQKTDVENQLIFLKNTLNHVMKINSTLKNKKAKKSVS